jgi:hypothetical protein
VFRLPEHGQIADPEETVEFPLDFRRTVVRRPSQEPAGVLEPVPALEEGERLVEDRLLEVLEVG